MRARPVVVVVMAVVAAGCAGDSPEAAPEDTATVAADPADEASPTPSAPTPAPSPSPTPTATPTVTETPVGLDLPRAVTYGGLVTTVESARVSNATVGTALDPEPEPGDQDVAYLTTTVGWEDGYPGGSTMVRGAWYALVLADGTVVPSQDVDFRSAHPVREGLPAEVVLGFPGVGADTLAGAALQVQEVGFTAATVPLSGDVPDEAFPVALDVAGEAGVSIEGGCEDGEAVTTLLGGEADLDGGVDHAGDRIVNSGSARATEGHVYVRLDFRTLAQSGSCGGAIADDEQYRLVVDGLPTAPVNRHVELLDPGTGTELTFGWLVPSDATLEVVVGTVDGTTATFPVPQPGTGNA